VESLRKLLPGYERFPNPLDVWQIPDFERDYVRCLQVAARDPGVDVVVAAIEMPADRRTGDSTEADIVTAACSLVSTEVPKTIAVLTTVSGDISPIDQETLRKSDVTLLSGIAQSLVALDRAVAFTAAQSHTPRVAKSASDCPDFVGTRPFGGEPALLFLATAGIPIVPTHNVFSVDEARAAARQFDYPLIVKIGDPAIIHKTEIGGVFSGIVNEAQLVAAAETLLARGLSGGLLIQPMLEGVELISQELCLEHLYLTVPLGATMLRVRLRPELRAGESLQAHRPQGDDRRQLRWSASNWVR